MTEFLSSVFKGNECINSFGSIYKEWFNSIHHVIKQSTAANYMMKAKKHLLPYFGTKCMSSINETSIYSFIKQKQREGLSSRYISDIIVLMKSIFKYAVKKYHIFNPLNGISLPKKKRSEVMLLDANEQNKLQTFINNNRNLSTLGTAISMTTGIRIGELCALQWSNVDFEKRVLKAFENLSGHHAVIRGLPGDSEMPAVPSNVTLFNHLETPDFAKVVLSAEHLISRPGYSTVMDMVYLGADCIFVPTPGQTEQVYLGKMLHRAQMAGLVPQKKLSSESLESAANETRCPWNFSASGNEAVMSLIFSASYTVRRGSPLLTLSPSDTNI